MTVVIKQELVAIKRKNTLLDIQSLISEIVKYQYGG